MVNVQVFTYSDPKSWRRHQQFPLMQPAFHMCATANMKRGIEAQYGDELSNIATVREVLTSFMPIKNWYNPEKRMKQYLEFASFMSNYPFSEETLRDAFKANKEDVLNTIRFLVQAGVTPSDLNGIKLVDKEHAFVQLWAKYETQDPSLNHHRQFLKYANNYQEAFRRQFHMGIGKRIYLHGFYFITPEQQQFFKFLVNNGFELIFFQYYDERFPETFDFIKLFIHEDYGWSSKWHIDDVQMPLTPIAEQFLTAYEDTTAPVVQQSMDITKYNSFFDFLQAVIIPHYPMDEAFNDNDVKIFAPNATELNELLAIYYPSLQTGNRQFLAHPIGRFIVNIHTLWQDDMLVLTGELLTELFASGWIIDEETGEKAVDYTYDVEQILPYFEGCHSLEEWMARITTLALQKQEIAQNFPAKTKARHDVELSSPFTKLSYFNVEITRLAQIKKFMEGIRLLAEDLFDAGGRSSVDTHFSKLLQMLKHRKRVDVYTNTLEQQVIDNLIERLNDVTDATEFLYEDIQPALFLYLSGRFEETDAAHQVMTDFLELDGEMFKEHRENVYFTAFDEQNIPLSEVPMPWPLQRQTIEELAQKNDAMTLFIHRNATVKETTRFLFFIALTFFKPQNFQLSWIVDRLTHEGLNVALYARQLGMNVQTYSPIDAQKTLPKERAVTSSALNETEKATFARIINDNTHGQMLLATYEICPKRFYYSYVLDTYATFNDKFMHQFMFTNIYRIAAGMKNSPAEQIVDDLSPYFPHLKRYLLHTIANDFHDRKYYFNASTDPIAPMVMNHLLPGFKRSEQEKAYASAAEGKSLAAILSDDELFEAKPSRHCTLCPHKNECPDVMYGVDR